MFTIRFQDRDSISYYGKDLNCNGNCHYDQSISCVSKASSSTELSYVFSMMNHLDGMFPKTVVKFCCA